MFFFHRILSYTQASLSLATSALRVGSFTAFFFVSYDRKQQKIFDLSAYTPFNFTCLHNVRAMAWDGSQNCEGLNRCTKCNILFIEPSMFNYNCFDGAVGAILSITLLIRASLQIKFSYRLSHV